MLVNAIIFNNEIDLLVFRLNYYKNSFDHYVILESTKTFSGNAKSIVSGSHTEKSLKNLFGNLTFIKLDQTNLNESDFSARWPVEMESRRQLLSFISKNFSGDSVICSDADEFPSHDQIENAYRLLKEKDGYIGCFELQTSYRFANWNLKDKFHKKWRLVSFFNATSINDKRIQNNAGRYSNFPVIDGEVGMHLSYLGFSSSDMTNKFKSFSHAEFDNDLPIDKIIKLSNVYAVDHLGRFRNRYFGLLSVDQIADLNSTQIFLLEKNPDLFNFEYARNIFLRLYASLAITKMIEDQDTFKIDPGILNGKISTGSTLYLLSEIAKRFWISIRYRLNLLFKKPKKQQPWFT